MIGRAAWIMLMVALAAIAAGAQLDRQTRRNPDLVRFVPSVLRGYAQWEVAADALESGDAAAALAGAQELVRRRPIPAENLLILAQAQQARGEEEQTLRTILTAAGRGWRSAPVQEAVLRLALEAGNDGEAGRRLAALWAIGDKGAALDDLSRAVLARPAAREVFAGQLAGTHRWQDRFLRQGAERAGPEAQTETVAAAIAHGARFDCRLLAGLARSRAEQGDARAAARLWAGPCAAAARAGAASPAAMDFPPDDDVPAGPFDWYYPPDATLTREIRQAGSGSVMDFDNDTLSIQPLATRLTALAPGQYVLDLSGQGLESVLLTEIACSAGGGKRQLLARKPGAGEIVFAVPGANCAVQQLDLRAWSGSAGGLRVELRRNQAQ